VSLRSALILSSDLRLCIPKNLFPFISQTSAFNAFPLHPVGKLLRCILIVITFCLIKLGCIVIYRPISRHVFYMVRAMHNAGQRIAKHISAEENARNNRTCISRQRPQYTGNNRITSVAMQRAVNTTIKEELFSMWFSYIHCWATDVFYGSASRLYKWYRIEIGACRE
jgi:hypothetical protein